jgi:hypothetical protein
MLYGITARNAAAIAPIAPSVARSRMPTGA